MIHGTLTHSLWFVGSGLKRPLANPCPRLKLAEEQLGRR